MLSSVGEGKERKKESKTIEWFEDYCRHLDY
jgi:hypothetical protein